MKKAILPAVVISGFIALQACKSADPKPVKDCKKNCVSLYSECIESCKVQQPPRDGDIRKPESYEYQNRVMMSGCASRCDDMKRKCYSDCESYRMFENNGAPEK
ncbi:MAG TPA: hypothetical protein ENN21_08565 [Spirochaetes bacterium]|nr:hypothetical protein [Spirochaetota bacterium]